MPKRTNDFQALVALVQGTLAPSGAKVAESAIVDVAGLEGGREIDVLVEGPFGNYEIKVAVEAKDLGRKMDLVTFESVVGKYTGEGRVRVNHVVVITRRGFAENVVAKAKMLDIELLTLAEAFDTDWTRFGPQKFHFKMAPHLCEVFFSPPIPGTPEEVLAEAHRVCAHGHRHESIRNFAEGLVKQALQSNPTLFEDMCAKALEEKSGQSEARIEANYDDRNWLVCFRGTHYPFKTMTVRLHVIVATANTVCSEVAMTGTDGHQQRLFRVQATTGGKSFEMLIPAGMRPERIAVRIKDAAQKPPEGPASDAGVS